MNKPFRFKQFEVSQDRCAMKIGTDGVLLGAWTALGKNPQSILDIGSGTGIIALMLAQRSLAKTIDAIEIDENAYEQCVDNFEASVWADRLFCYHAGLDEFVEEIENKYDLIVSNPPFYSEGFSSENMARAIARQNTSLPFDELLKGVSKLLSEDGVFSTILPFKEEEAFIALGLHSGLFAKRITRVKGSPSSEIKRSLIEFSFERQEVDIEELVIEKQRHVYTKKYVNLTKDFYLKM